MISCKLQAKIEMGEIISVSNIPCMNSFVFSSANPSEGSP